jgi:hypothetical protein
MHEEDAGAFERIRIKATFTCFDSKQRVEFGLPLAEQSLWNDQKYAAHTFGEQLCDDQTGLDCLAEADFVSENAPAFGDALKRKHHRVDLVRIRINPASPLSGGVSPVLVGPAQPHQVLREQASMNRVGIHYFWFSPTPTPWRCGRPGGMSDERRAQFKRAPVRPFR